MMVKRIRFNLLMVIFALSLFLAGCNNYDGNLIRADHVKDYQSSLTEKTNSILSKESFGLKDCIEIALKNNLNVKASRIQERMARLERKVAFSSFILVVNFDY